MVELFAAGLFNRTPGSHLVPGQWLLRALDSPRQPELNEPPFSDDHEPLGGICTHFALYGSKDFAFECFSVAQAPFQEAKTHRIERRD